MRLALAAPIVLLPADPTEMVVDLFALEKTPLPFLRKRPRIDGLDAARLEAGLTKE